MRLFDDQGIEDSIEISLKQLVSIFVDIAEELVKEDLAAAGDRETTLTPRVMPTVAHNCTP